MTLHFVVALLGTWVREGPGRKKPRVLSQHETGGNKEIEKNS